MWFPKVLNVSMLQLLISSHHNRESMVSHSDNREHIKLLLCTHANKRTMVSCSTNRDHAQAEFYYHGNKRSIELKAIMFQLFL